MPLLCVRYISGAGLLFPEEPRRGLRVSISSWWIPGRVDLGIQNDVRGTVEKVWTTSRGTAAVKVKTDKPFQSGPMSENKTTEWNFRLLIEGQNWTSGRQDFGMIEEGDDAA